MTLSQKKITTSFTKKLLLDTVAKHHSKTTKKPPETLKKLTKNPQKTIKKLKKQ
jgi:hypothetical protein